MISVKEYLSRSTQCLLKFLEQHLPALGEDSWWQRTVIDKLSDQQAKIAEQKNYSVLSDFDQAALLNLLEKNWRSITTRSPSLDYRRGLNLIIELKNIRNHYAHEPTSGTALDQQLRDVDSITRLLKMLSAESALIDEGEALHRDLMMRMLNLPSDQVTKVKPVSEKLVKLTLTKPKKEIDNTQKGVPVHWLKAGTILEQDVLKKLCSATYVGIDFGTSTSVVSIATVGENNQGLQTKSIKIKQLDDLGREIHSSLVSTCLAWFNQKLLFGVGAARLKQELINNQTIWTSFKMGLGIDLGPVYNRTALRAGKFEYTIEKPQHAAAVFLKFLHDGIREYVRENNLPEKIYYTVTVPASFEANQRNDLFAALEFAGIPKDEIRLMDEPNAAFLSYLVDTESRSSEGRFVDTLQAKKRNIIVFDFGAGTCDISVLEVSAANESILSRNLGISKFWALGGDDIDKVIAEKILLPQLCGAENVAKYLFTSTQLEQQVLPHLKAIAEALKIACCELAEQNGWKTIEDLKRAKNQIIKGRPGVPFKIAERDWQLAEPQIRLDQFAEVMGLFIRQPSNLKGGTKVIDALQPIDNALEKIELTKEDIDMVLFIGGSCENPLIRHYVSKHLGRFVESITPRDLRGHVSQGAALYTLFLRGADIDPIKPITSETIYVMTIGERLVPVIKASSLVPSEGELQEDLIVTRSLQKLIELPFYSGTINKPIGIMKLKPPRGSSGFQKGTNIKIQWSISKEKILRIVTEVKGNKKSADFENPLANEELTEEVLPMLKAKQAFNQSVLDGKGRPSASATLAYANAAKNARYWRLAAEMLELAERLDEDMNHSTNICYYYSMDGDHKSSYKWSKIAYARKPSAITAYNLAIDNFRNQDMVVYEQLMQECLEHDPNYTAALVGFGLHLTNQGDTEGVELLQRAFDIFIKESEAGDLEGTDVQRFRRVANALGKQDTLLSVKDLHEPKKSSRVISFDNLVGTLSSIDKQSNSLGGN